MGASGTGALIGALVLARRTSLRGLGTWVASAALGLRGRPHRVLALPAVLAVRRPAACRSASRCSSQMSSSNTLIQSMVPDELRGRVMSVYSMMFMGMAPVGALLAGHPGRAGGRADDDRGRRRGLHRGGARLPVPPAAVPGRGAATHSGAAGRRRALALRRPAVYTYSDPLGDPPMTPTVADLRREYARARLDERDVSHDPDGRVRPLVRRGPGGTGARAQRDDPRHGRRGRRAVRPHRPAQGVRRARLRLLHRLPEPQGRWSSASNPRAALVFYWAELERQVGSTGTVSRTALEESERVLPEPAAGQPARGLGLASEPGDRGPRGAGGGPARRRGAGIPTATSRCRPTGAASGWSRRRSSSGRAGRAGCTTGSDTVGRPEGRGASSGSRPRPIQVSSSTGLVPR